MQDYRKLKVWEKAHALVLAIYTLTKMFPREETYGIVAQLRRTAVTVPMKIAEACGQSNDHDFARLMSAAIGAEKELDYLMLLARDLHYMDDAAYDIHRPMADEVAKMLFGLLRKTSN